MPERIQRKRTRGWRMPPNAVYVGRPTKLGNDWEVGASATIRVQSGPACVFSDWPMRITAAMAVELYRQQWEKRLAPLRPDAHPADVHYQRRDVELIRELSGRDLACWCPLDDAEGNRVPCHADVLLEIANREAPRD